MYLLVLLIHLRQLHFYRQLRFHQMQEQLNLLLRYYHSLLQNQFQ